MPHPEEPYDHDRLTEDHLAHHGAYDDQDADRIETAFTRSRHGRGAEMEMGL